MTRGNDLTKALEIVRKIDNVNYTDEYDRSLLMYASAKGYTSGCRVLLQRGADPDLQAIDGLTALMYASFNGYPRIVKLLIGKRCGP